MAALILPYYIHKYLIFSRKSLATIFILGMVVVVASIAIPFQIKDIRLAGMMMGTLLFTMVVFPDIFATSLLARENKRNVVFAFYF